MRTVQEIFDEAIHLIDAQNEQTGSTATADTKEYEVRAAKLLSTLLNEAYPYSDTYSADEWDSGKAYLAGECVIYNGLRYLCEEDVGAKASAPPTDARWVCTGKAGKRPTHPPVANMTDPVYMDDFICLSALPAGLRFGATTRTGSRRRAQRCPRRTVSRKSKTPTRMAAPALASSTGVSDVGATCNAFAQTRAR